MNNYYDNMLCSLKDIIAFKTVLGAPEENAPYGKENRKCLSYILGLGEQMGFKVKDIEGHAGHIEWTGKGKGLLGILGHVDVVPAGEGWSSDPFTLTIKEGYAYGRGVLDDKGPILSCLYAMKKLKDEGYEPEKTIRVIIGCNEENGSSCVKRYFKTEEMPDVGFSPDADFPVIHCEKGILWLGIKGKSNLKEFKEIQGGDKTNMVPSKATATYYGDLSAEFFENKGLAVERDLNSMALILTSKGKAVHGSTPSKGENAIWHLLSVILEVENDESLAYLYENFAKDYDGECNGLKCYDEKSGDLTQNLGTIELKDGTLSVSVDIRYPILLTEEKIYEIIKRKLPVNLELSTLNAQEYLYVDPDDELVQTLMEIYKKHTGSNSKSLIIGGGTYARELTHGVGFGPIFEDEESTIHMSNERLSLVNYERMLGIYFDSIKALSSKA